MDDLEPQKTGECGFSAPPPLQTFPDEEEKKEPDLITPTEGAMIPPLAHLHIHVPGGQSLTARVRFEIPPVVGDYIRLHVDGAPARPMKVVGRQHALGEAEYNFHVWAELDMGYGREENDDATGTANTNERGVDDAEEAV